MITKQKYIEDIFRVDSSKRSLTVNLILCVISFVLFLILPGLFYNIFYSFMKTEMNCEIISRLLTIVIIGGIYYKDLVKEFRELKNNPGYKIGQSFKFYGIGLGVMMISNMILLLIFKDISTNENEVRGVLLGNPLPMLVTISILAPVMEEIVFRKSLSPLFKNKYLFAIVSGLLFGLAHLMVDFTSPGFEFTRLLYVIPYGSLGFAFAMMNRNCNSTFSSIFIHCLHNTVTALLILSQGGM